MMKLTKNRWLFLFILLVILISTLPYAIAFSKQSPDWQFSGFLIGVEDGNSYIAKMLRGGQGDWLFRSSYSAEEQGGALLYMPYLLLGKILGPDGQHDQLVLLFHLFRLVAAALFCWATYDFLAHFLQRKSSRQLGLALAIFGGGLGWVLLIFGRSNWLGSLPLEFYSPESFGFLALFGLPHLALGRALMFWAILNYLKGDRQRGNSFLTILLWLAILLAHLLSAVIGLFVIGLHFFLDAIRKPLGHWKQINLQRLLWPLLGAGIPLVLNLYLLVSDHYLQAWAAQNQIISPHFLHYLFAYGLLFPFTIIGVKQLLKNKADDSWLLVAWLLAMPLLLYLPLGLQRRFAEGIWLAIIVLALKAFESGHFSNRQSWRWLFAAAFPSALILLIGAGQVASYPRAPVFHSSQQVKVLEELRVRAKDQDIVLTNFELSNMIPAWAPARVVIGHGPESVGLAKLQPPIEAFLIGENEDYGKEIFEKYEVRFVIWVEEITDIEINGFEFIGNFGEHWLYENLSDGN